MTDVELRLTADVGQATKGISGFRKEFADMVKAVEKPLGKIDALQKVQESAKQASTAFFDARQRVTNLQQALEKVGPPAAKLGQALAQAEKEMSRATGAVDRQKKKLEEQRVAVLASKQALDALKQAQAGVDGGAVDKASVQAMANAKQAVAAATAEYEKQRTALAAHQHTLTASRASVKALSEEHRAAQNPVSILEKELSKAERNLARTTQEFDRQKAKVREQRTELKAAGVDTRNLATEQQRLQAELAKATLAGRRDQAVSGIRAQAAALAQVTREQRQANLETARSSLGVTQYRNLQAELARLRNQYQQVRTAGSLTNQELGVAQQTLKRRIQETTQALRDMTSAQSRVGGGAFGGGLGGAATGLLGGFGAVESVRGYVAATDAAKQMSAQLRLATNTQEEFNRAQAETFRIAQENQAPIRDVVTLYSRLTPALREVGRGQDDALKIIEAVTQSLRISGATAQETASTIQQFSQALGSGVLRGEEFNTLAESSPRLLRALADALDVNVGALRDMAAEGQLTADVISDALIGQLPKLNAEAAQLPETLGGATTKFSNSLAALIGRIDELSGTSESAISILNRLSLAMGNVDGVKSGGSLERTIGALGVISKFNPLSLQGLATLFNVQDYLNGLVKQITAEKETYAYREGLFDLHQKEMQILRGQEIKDHSASVTEIKKIQDEHVKAAERGAKDLVAAETKATAELKKVRDDRLKIEERYKEALAGLGGEGTASYANAQALKVGAREALAAGDIKGAQAQAQAALKMLQDLASAGENTYGFSGFIQELQAIELAANDIEQTNAENKIKAIKAEMLDLKVKAAALEDMPVSVKMDDAALAAVKSAIADLANTKIMVKIGAQYDFTTPYTLQDPGPEPGFAAGGWTGPGSKYQAAGVVHADEHVQPKRVVNEPGALPFLEQIRRQGFRNTMSQMQSRMASGMRGYAEGGLVMPSRAMPSIPQISPSLMAGSDPLKDWGKATLSGPDGSYEVLMRKPAFEQILSRTAMKHGRTHK